MDEFGKAWQEHVDKSLESLEIAIKSAKLHRQEIEELINNLEDLEQENEKLFHLIKSIDFMGELDDVNKGFVNRIRKILKNHKTYLIMLEQRVQKLINEIKSQENGL